MEVLLFRRQFFDNFLLLFCQLIFLFHKCMRSIHRAARELLTFTIFFSLVTQVCQKTESFSLRRNLFIKEIAILSQPLQLGNFSLSVSSELVVSRLDLQSSR